MGFELLFWGFFFSLFLLFVFGNLLQVLYHIRAFENEDFLLDFYLQSKITK